MDDQEMMSLSSELSRVKGFIEVTTLVEIQVEVPAPEQDSTDYGICLNRILNEQI